MTGYGFAVPKKSKYLPKFNEKMIEYRENGMHSSFIPIISSLVRYFLNISGYVSRLRLKMNINIMFFLCHKKQSPPNCVLIYSVSAFTS